MTTYLLLAGLLASTSSSTPPLSLPPLPALVNTVWVPRSINWVQPFPRDVELRGIEYADFALLCFRTQGQFMRVSSYHSRGDYDTILVATEPGVRVDYGHYRISANRLIVTAKTGYRTIDFRPAGQLDQPRTDTLCFRGRYLLYRGVEYRPTTKLAGQRLRSFWAHTPAK
jgi:hypothetical protein